MGFLLANFLPLSGMANSDGPRHYTYKTVDNKATVVASAYFNDRATTLNVGDVIWVVGVTGGTEVFFMVFVDAISAAGVVTTLSSTLTLA